MTKAAKADVMLRALTSKYTKDLKKAEKETKDFAKSAKNSLVSGFKGGFGALAGLGTAGGIADIASDVVAFEQSLVRLQIQAKGAADLDAIRSASTRLALGLGVTRNSVVEAANALTNRLGPAAATADKIEVLTEAHVATGASMEDLALLVLKLDKAFGLKTADEWREGLSAMIEVGKAGSVPLNEMATVIAQSGSQFARFGKQGKEAAAEIGALIQLAVAGGKAGGFGSAAEAGTGLRAFITQLDQSEQGLRAMGIKVKEVGADGNKQFRPMANILADIRKKNLVNKAAFTQVFGSSQARDFLSILLEQEDALRELTKVGVESKASQEDAQAFANSSAGKMQRAWQALRLEIEQVFTPERLATMVEIAEALGVALGFVVDNWKLFLAGFLAIKGAQLGRSLLAWSRNAKGLAGNLAEVAAGAKNAGTELGAMAPAGGTPKKKGGRLGKLAAAVGPELALTGGLIAGQMLGGAIVGERQERFAAAKKRQQESLSQNARVSEAMLALTDAGVVTEGGQLAPEFEQQLQTTLASGGPLTELQRQALLALQGFEEVEKASAGVFGGGGGFSREMRAELKKQFGVDLGPKTRQVITSAEGLTPELAAARLAEADARATMAALQAEFADLAASMREIAGRPIELRVDGNVVAQANENAQTHKRRPAP